MWWTAALSFLQKGGYKIFIYLAAALAFYLTVSLIISKIEDGATAQAEAAQLTRDLTGKIEQQRLDNERISGQNDEILRYVENSRVNAATIGVLSRRLADLDGTITPDISPVAYQAELEAIVRAQYICLERVTQGETNAQCN